MSWVLTDEETTYVTELRNGVLNHRPVADPASDGTVFSLTRATLIGVVTGAVDLATAVADGRVGLQGDPSPLQRLVALLAPVDPDFAIVTP